MAICKVSTSIINYRIDQRAFKILQMEGPGKEGKEREALGIIESQAEVLDWSVVTLESDSDKDMEAHPSDCRAANKELTNILTIMDGTQSRTAAARSREKRIMKCLNHIMDIIDDKYEEANE